VVETEGQKGNQERKEASEDEKEKRKICKIP